MRRMTVIEAAERLITETERYLASPVAQETARYLRDQS
jgi:hypothetical protein